MIKPRSFAYLENRHYIILSELAKVETNPSFRRTLTKFARHELNDFHFWKQYSPPHTYRPNPLTIITLKIMRKILGLTFVIKYLEHEEKNLLAHYQNYAHHIRDLRQKAMIKSAIKHKIEHERELISQIKEDRVEFISSIILGINDSLIELTGALVGFSLVLQNHTIIALTGTITGLAAALSMSSSAYMQASYEPGKNAKKSAFYTGLAYLIVVGILVMPFLLFSTLLASLLGLLLSGLLITIVLSYYTSIIFDRPLTRQLTQMLIFSLGTAAITFSIGYALRIFLSLS